MQKRREEAVKILRRSVIYKDGKKVIKHTDSFCMTDREHMCPFLYSSDRWMCSAFDCYCPRRLEECKKATICGQGK